MRIRRAIHGCCGVYLFPCGDHINSILLDICGALFTALEDGAMQAIFNVGAGYARDSLKSALTPAEATSGATGIAQQFTDSLIGALKAGDSSKVLSAEPNPS